MSNGTSSSSPSDSDSAVNVVVGCLSAVQQITIIERIDRQLDGQQRNKNLEADGGDYSTGRSG